MDFHQILTDGGAGDLICELVAVDWNIKHHPNVTFHVWVPDYLLSFAQHVLTKGAIVRSFSQAEKEFRHEIEGMTTEWCTNHTPMRTHPVDYGFHMLSDRHIYDMNQKNYLQVRPNEIDISHYKLPKHYAVIQSTFSEPVKTMPTETFNGIVDYLIKQDVVPVFLGKETSPCGYKDFAVKGVPIEANLSRGINLINQTDLLQGAAIISKSKVYIGMDSGLTHLAGCTKALILAGYTLVDPVHVAPIRNGFQDWAFFPIEPPIILKNRYYQTWNSGFKKGDFRKFPGWEQVVQSITADKFIKQLSRIGFANDIR